MQLNKGDWVWWRHAWGAEPPRPAKIKRIEDNVNSGVEFDSIDWDKVKDRDVIVDLSTSSNWAYGFQISPLTDAERELLNEVREHELGLSPAP
jgi:hypothetical protein